MEYSINSSWNWSVTALRSLQYKLLHPSKEQLNRQQAFLKKYACDIKNIENGWEFEMELPTINKQEEIIKIAQTIYQQSEILNQSEWSQCRYSKREEQLSRKSIPNKIFEESAGHEKDMPIDNWDTAAAA